MGDRANIYVTDQVVGETETDTGQRPGIYLYTHWDGDEWPERLRLALVGGRGRWGDPQYLTRIIAREVFAGLDGDTGGGISTVMGDGNGIVIVCDVVNDVVAFCDEGGEASPNEWHTRRSFEEFVALETAEYPA